MIVIFPPNPVPSPKSYKKCDLYGHRENGPAEFHGFKGCRNNASCCFDKGFVLAWGGVEFHALGLQLYSVAVGTEQIYPLSLICKAHAQGRNADSRAYLSR